MLIVFAGVVAVAVLLLAIMVPTLLGQLDQVQTQLPELRSNFEAWVSSLQPGLLKDTLTQLVAATGDIASEPVAADPEVLLSAGITIAESAFAVMTIVALILFWLTGHQRMERFLFALVAAERRAGVREAWDVVQGRLGYWVRGQLILMVSIFVMTTVAYFVLGLPNALLLGVLAGIAELVPIVGPALGAVPALLAAGLMPDPVASALLVGGVYVVIQVFEGNVLVPIVMKNAVGVPPFLVVMSLIIGAAAAGSGRGDPGGALDRRDRGHPGTRPGTRCPGPTGGAGPTSADDDDDTQSGTALDGGGRRPGLGERRHLQRWRGGTGQVRAPHPSCNAHERACAASVITLSTDRTGIFRACLPNPSTRNARSASVCSIFRWESSLMALEMVARLPRSALLWSARDWLAANLGLEPVELEIVDVSPEDDAAHVSHAGRTSDGGGHRDRPGPAADLVPDRVVHGRGVHRTRFAYLRGSPELGHTKGGPPSPASRLLENWIRPGSATGAGDGSCHAPNLVGLGVEIGAEHRQRQCRVDVLVVVVAVDEVAVLEAHDVGTAGRATRHVATDRERVGPRPAARRS